MPTTAMLVRWNGGWIECTRSIGTYGRKEAFLSVGAAQSGEEARVLGDGQLADFAKVREGVTVETDPADDAIPYFNYDNGDTIMIADSALYLRPTRVTSISMVEDDEGIISWVPEAGDLVIGEHELFIAPEETLFRQRANTGIASKVRTP